MNSETEVRVLEAFRSAVERVPAYRTLVQEAGLRAQDVRTLAHFTQLPLLSKRNTFQRFRLQELCLDGDLGRPGSVLTSSGHSGVFAFGITDANAMEGTVTWIDDALDYLFAVRSRPTLLINCLPMGVKVPSRACTLAETSVRPDMVVGLVKAFAEHYDQFVLVGEAAFVKRVLEMGREAGVDWRKHTVQVILGEETLAENARRYLGDILGHDVHRPAAGIVFSSMGVAEVGLNIFFEIPPVAPLIALRRLLHTDASLRHAVLGDSDWVPSIFTFDPGRVFVEFIDGRLVLTTLDPKVRVPLIRYATGDQGAFLRLPPSVRSTLEKQGIAWEVLESIPVVTITGRGEYVSAGETCIYPEAVKEGIYHEAALAELTTANFRLTVEEGTVVVRIQLSPGTAHRLDIEERFHAALALYVRGAFTVRCEVYEHFGNGMALDYERKFQYIER